MKFFVILLFSTFILCNTQSMNAQAVSVLDSISEETIEFLVKQNKHNEKTYRNYISATYSGKVKKRLKDLSETMFEGLELAIEDQDFLYDQRLVSYLQDVAKEMNQSQDLRPFNLIATRFPSINAGCLLDGTILLNQGLFRDLENENQFFAVLCHEIAHNQLLHGENQIALLVAQDNNPDLKETVRDLKNSKEVSHNAAKDLLRNILYKNSAEKRKKEQEADSLGYLIYKKLGRKKEDYVNSLKHIQVIDSTPTIKIPRKAYEKIFNLKEYPFQKEWLSEEDFSQYNYDNYEAFVDEDSIQTHPEIEERILSLKDAFPELSKKEKSEPTLKGAYAALALLADQEIVHNSIVQKNYGLALYLGIYRHSKTPEDSYNNKLLGLLFGKLYDAKKKYLLNKYVQHVKGDMEDESFKRFLNFVWNLDLEAMQKFSSYFKEMAGD